MPRTCARRTCEAMLARKVSRGRELESWSHRCAWHFYFLRCAGRAANACNPSVMVPMAAAQPLPNAPRVAPAPVERPSRRSPSVRMEGATFSKRFALFPTEAMMQASTLAAPQPRSVPPVAPARAERLSRTLPSARRGSAASSKRSVRPEMGAVIHPSTVPAAPLSLAGAGERTRASAVSKAPVFRNVPSAAQAARARSTPPPIVSNAAMAASLVHSSTTAGTSSAPTARWNRAPRAPPGLAPTVPSPTSS